MQTARTVSQGHAPSAPLSIDEVRRRARHRLIGAAVLVLLGVVGFSLLFDTQPRPLPVDIPIVIPSKAAAPSVTGKAAAPDKSAASVKPASAAATGVPASDSLGPQEEMVASSTGPEAGPQNKPEPQSAAKSEDKATDKVEKTEKVEAKAEPKPAVPAAKPSDADRARALLDGKAATDKAAEKPADKADTAAQRIVVQVGAFSDVARAREARLKLERAGLKTYTHVAETPDGKRIRVRVGPYATKAEADKAAARVKALGLPAAILTL